MLRRPDYCLLAASTNDDGDARWRPSTVSLKHIFESKRRRNKLCEKYKSSVGTQLYEIEMERLSDSLKSNQTTAYSPLSEQNARELIIEIRFYLVIGHSCLVLGVDNQKYRNKLESNIELSSKMKQKALSAEIPNGFSCNQRRRRRWSCLHHSIVIFRLNF